MRSAPARERDRLGAGIALKPEHYEAALAARHPGLWFEVHAENYLVDGGPRPRWLAAIARHHPISFHGVSASLGGAAGPPSSHLEALARLCERVPPALVSEHLAWSRPGIHWVPDLLPVPRTRAALERIAGHVSRLQDRLGRRIAIENPAHYLQTPAHEIDEVDFIEALCRRTGCGWLLDLDNVVVSANNLGFDPGAWLARVPGAHVDEIHLAGHSIDTRAGVPLFVDSHDEPVGETVWRLLDAMVARIGPRPVLIERDGKLPPFEQLLAERDRAQSVLDRHADRRAGEVLAVAGGPP